MTAWRILAAPTALFGGLVAASAQAAGGLAEPWQLGMQAAVTPVAEQLHDFHNMLLVIITLITLFVLGLLFYVLWRFSEKRNPTPSRTSHNTLLEIVWTVVPVLILIFIAVPSFALIYRAEVVPKADMTIKATGHQWYWEYEYPDHGGFSFD
ncbi:MAG: cytochrome c oxidase subunit II transmembrane domain-containing protein, partial [Alphaproteobacteria bacterium]|nr:cytochrome c oxidase subunit II transmembrane domain-containing protein [Alphaproteobacteria bacterium]